MRLHGRGIPISPGVSAVLVLAALGATPAGCATAPASTGSGDVAGSTDPNAPSTAPAPPGAGTATPSPSPPSSKTGTLLFATGAPIANLAYESGPHKGMTDASGSFTYDEGSTVRFLLGEVLLGAPLGADVLSPYQIVGAATCEDTDALKSLVALLEALDVDVNVANGITLPAVTPKSPTLPAVDAALRTFITAFDGEAWTPVAMDTFSYTDALLRGQGVATDGTSWFFSGTTGLEKTNASFATSTKNALAIPLLLAAAGSDHIGDIDFYNGKIYAPIEDKGYTAPKVVLFDPSLNAGTVYDIPWALQTKGVPWIAVDGPRGFAYMAEWDPTPAVNVFALATMTFLHAIPLSSTVGRVQGGKVYKGQLYFSTDTAQKRVFKIHLASGTIFPLFDIAADGEVEGLAFLQRGDGSLMHTLDVTAASTGVNLRHHKIIRAPLRWTVCP